jgi:hypothetical protein
MSLRLRKTHIGEPGNSVQTAESARKFGPFIAGERKPRRLPGVVAPVLLSAPPTPHVLSRSAHTSDPSVAVQRSHDTIARARPSRGTGCIAPAPPVRAADAAPHVPALGSETRRTWGGDVPRHVPEQSSLYTSARARTAAAAAAKCLDGLDAGPFSGGPSAAMITFCHVTIWLVGVE